MAVHKRTGITRLPWKWLRNTAFVIMVALWLLLTLNLLWPVISNLSNVSSGKKLLGPGSINYLIIAPNALSRSASAWAEYRRSTGYETQVVLFTPSQAEKDSIRKLIRETYARSKEPDPFYVLLIGHAHPFSSHPDTYLPAPQFFVSPDQSSGYGSDPIASDDAFIANFSSGIPSKTLPIFIGRVPAQTEEEAFLLLERTQRYEKSPPTGAGRARIELITSNAGFGPQYDPLFDWALKTLMQEILPDEYQWHMLNGNRQSPYSYPVDSFPNEVAKRFDSAALAVVYVGHGQPELLGWAYSPHGRRGRIFGFEDSALIQDASSSIGIFTACSAGDYHLAGDNISIVESIYLTPGGPVAVYSSSAWINGALNGRLVIDIFEALLIDNTSTLGAWVNRVENESAQIHSRSLLASFVKATIPRISGNYENKLFLSKARAHQVLDIQNATYNLFGDPALRIAYAESKIRIHPTWLWQPWKGDLVFSGKSELPAGQQVLISLETLPGAAHLDEHQSSGMIDGYLQANDPVISTTSTNTELGGNFSGRISIPVNAPSGKYLLKAVSSLGSSTFITAQPVYIGWSAVMEVLFSTVFWWTFISGLFITQQIYQQIHRDHNMSTERAV